MNKKIQRIILTDDDPDDQLLFQTAIKSIAIEKNLDIFNNGQELMEYLRQPDIILPDLVFLDLNMPIKNGMQCLQEIREDNRLRKITVAIYSTSSSEEDIEETFINGANVYINKPNSFQTLKKVVEQVLKTDWQYQTSNLKKDNFLLRI